MSELARIFNESKNSTDLYVRYVFENLSETSSSQALDLLSEKDKLKAEAHVYLSAELKTQREEYAHLVVVTRKLETENLELLRERINEMDEHSRYGELSDYKLHCLERNSNLLEMFKASFHHALSDSDCSNGDGADEDEEIDWKDCADNLSETSSEGTVDVLVNQIKEKAYKQKAIIVDGKQSEIEFLEEFLIPSGEEPKLFTRKTTRRITTPRNATTCTAKTNYMIEEAFDERHQELEVRDGEDQEKQKQEPGGEQTKEKEQGESQEKDKEEELEEEQSRKDDADTVAEGDESKQKLVPTEASPSPTQKSSGTDS
eukprot:Nk52_evm2s2622 gene=Nk52_evmTU2s2622